MDLSLGQIPRPVTAPGSDILFATDPAKDSKLTFDMLLFLITVIRAVSVHVNHSPTIRAACKERRGDASLQAAYVGIHFMICSHSFSFLDYIFITNCSDTLTESCPSVMMQYSADAEIFIGGERNAYEAVSRD